MITLISTYLFWVAFDIKINLQSQFQAGFYRIFQWGNFFIREFVPVMEPNQISMA